MADLLYNVGPNTWVSLKGADGDPGTKGDPGDSAYAIAVAGGFVGTNAEWLTSLTGADGPKGDPGQDGTGVSILGSFSDAQALTDGTDPLTLAPGDAYIVDGNLFVWDDDNQQFVDVGTIQGPAGDKGEPGADGKDGLSAYEIAVAGGFTGDQTQFTDSLKGDKGDTGDKGDPGADGNPGTNGQSVTVYQQVGMPDVATANPGDLWIVP